jgi:hypothetical protein
LIFNLAIINYQIDTKAAIYKVGEFNCFFSLPLLPPETFWITKFHFTLDVFGDIDLFEEFILLIKNQPNRNLFLKSILELKFLQYKEEIPPIDYR